MYGTATPPIAPCLPDLADRQNGSHRISREPQAGRRVSSPQGAGLMERETGVLEPIRQLLDRPLPVAQIQRQVALGSRQAGMAEQRLDATQIGAGAQQLDREAMA